MSMFNEIVSQRVDPQTGTERPSEVRKKEAEALVNGAANWAIMNVQMGNEMMGKFWGTKDPQKLADELDAQKGVGFTKQLFALHGELMAFIATKVPSLAKSIHKRPDTHTIVENEDGSLTITEK